MLGSCDEPIWLTKSEGRTSPAGREGATTRASFRIRLEAEPMPGGCQRAPSRPAPRRAIDGVDAPALHGRLGRGRPRAQGALNARANAGLKRLAGRVPQD